MIDIGSILVPLLASFHPRIRFYKHWQQFLLPCLLVSIFFILWDVLFTGLGIWSFNSVYLSGIQLFSLPVEEVLFFVCIPYACVFTYYCLRLFTHSFNFNLLALRSSWLLAAVSLAVALLNLPLYYTSSSFGLLALCLIILAYSKARYMAAFFISFLTILPFFFLTNGLLTGSFISQPIVLYNDNFNLGFRLFTIPIEDVFYGMLLLLLNVAGFEHLIKKKALAQRNWYQ